MIIPTTDRFDNFDLIQNLVDIKPKEEWRTYYEKGWHINLEMCDNNNDFEWLEQNIHAKDFFIWHSCMVIFPMENWKKWLSNNKQK